MYRKVTSMFLTTRFKPTTQSDNSDGCAHTGTEVCASLMCIHYMYTRYN